MKLLFVLPEFGPATRGGIATFYAHLLPALRSAGCAVDVCVTDPDAVPSTDGGINVVRPSTEAVQRARGRLRHFAGTPGVLHLLALAVAAWEACGRGAGYDVVETTDYGLAFAPWVATGDGPPVVVQLHGSSGQVDYHDPIAGQELSGLVTRLLETALLGRAEELQAYGSPNQAGWSALLGRPVELIPPTWRPTPSSSGALPSVSPAAAGVERGGLVVGRIQVWKGPETLCRAAELLEARAPRVLWAGRDNPYRDLRRSMSAHLGASFPSVWGRSIVPIGEHPRDAVAALQAAARFTVVPSDWDTFNLAAAESLAAGSVVICSEGAGAADVIEHGVSGLRFAAGDAPALAELLERAASMPEAERRAMGAHARDAVASQLSVDATLPRRLEGYRRVSAGGARRASSAWTDGLFAPSAAMPELAFLEQVPMRAMMRQVVMRTLDKSRRVFG